MQAGQPEDRAWDNQEKELVMTVTIEFPPDVEADLLAQARAEGLDVAGYVRNLVQKQIFIGNTAAKSTLVEELTPEEWTRRFKEWAHSHDHDNLPPLSDYAVSRDSMYD
jgi:hypothetical protein